MTSLFYAVNDRSNNRLIAIEIIAIEIITIVIIIKLVRITVTVKRIDAQYLGLWRVEMCRNGFHSVGLFPFPNPPFPHNNSHSRNIHN